MLCRTLPQQIVLRGIKREILHSIALIMQARIELAGNLFPGISTGWLLHQQVAFAELIYYYPTLFLRAL
jgi:hypothetical protein